MPRVVPRLLFSTWGCRCEEEPAHSQQTNTTQVRLAITRRTPHMGTSAPPSAAVCACPSIWPLSPIPSPLGHLNKPIFKCKGLKYFRKKLFSPTYFKLPGCLRVCFRSGATSVGLIGMFFRPSYDLETCTFSLFCDARRMLAENLMSQRKDAALPYHAYIYVFLL